MSDAELRLAKGQELEAADWDGLAGLLDKAFDEPFTPTDWEIMRPGIHFLLEEAGEIVSHACVIERELHTCGHELATGWIEAMATRPALQGHGLGTKVLQAVTGHIAQNFRLGGLTTGSFGFYERLGWLRWRGPAFARTEQGAVRTEEFDGHIMVLSTPSSPGLDLDAPISCEWRPGDVW